MIADPIYMLPKLSPLSFVSLLQCEQISTLLLQADKSSSNDSLTQQVNYIRTKDITLLQDSVSAGGYLTNPSGPERTLQYSQTYGAGNLRPLQKDSILKDNILVLCFTSGHSIPFSSSVSVLSSIF
ncbi:hypothetical protein FKM82_030899 [Ascaphus truei]